MGTFFDDATAQRLQRAIHSIDAAGHGMMTVMELDRLLALAVQGDKAPRNPDAVVSDRMLVLRGLGRRSEASAGRVEPVPGAKLMVFEALMILEGRSVPSADTGTLSPDQSAAGIGA